jgi:hypothetical protein
VYLVSAELARLSLSSTIALMRLSRVADWVSYGSSLRGPLMSTLGCA